MSPICAAMCWRSPPPGRSMAAPAPSICCSASRPRQLKLQNAGKTAECPSPRLAQKRGLRVELASEARRRGPRKAQCHRAASGGGERRCDTVAQQGRPEGIRHHEATFFGDENGWELVRHSEVKPVREFPIAGPFTVGAEIGHRALDLDNDEIAGFAKRQNVGPLSVGERKFGEAGITELIERAADAARQQQGGGGAANGAV